MKFGLELTYIKAKRDVYDIYDEISNLGFPADIDDGALEIPTPVFASIAGFERWYKRFEKKVIKPYKLRAQATTREGDTIYIESTGGGHIHIDIPNKIRHMARFIENVKRANTFYYYFRWLFGDITETDNIVHPNTSWHFVAEKVPSNIITIRKNTLEYRFFTAPRNLEESKLFIKLALAINKSIFRDHLVYGNFSYLYRDSEDHIKRAFEEDFKDFGLDIKPYKKYLKNYNEYRKYHPLI